MKGEVCLISEGFLVRREKKKRTVSVDLSLGFPTKSPLRVLSLQFKKGIPVFYNVEIKTLS